MSLSFDITTLSNYNTWLSSASAGQHTLGLTAKPETGSTSYIESNKTTQTSGGNTLYWYVFNNTFSLTGCVISGVTSGVAKKDGKPSQSATYTVTVDSSLTSTKNLPDSVTGADSWVLSADKKSATITFTTNTTNSVSIAVVDAKQRLSQPVNASLSGTTASVSPVEHATGYTVVETVGGSDVIVSEYTAPQYEYTIDPNTLMMKVTTAPYTIETGGILKI